MTRARAFRAVRYDPTRVELSNVIVPPYDVVADDERGSFYDRDPHNAIRFELTKDAADEAATDYAQVREALDAWRAEGVLARDDAPAYYVMRQRFVSPDGRPLERIGFFAELGLEDYDERIVRPHERTLAGPKKDRLKVLRASRANLSPVFLLYEDRDETLAAILAQALEDDLLGSATDDTGVEYALARVADADAVARVEAFMAERPVVIADGHHRYETALAYRDEQRDAHGVDPEAPCESTLAYFANAFAPGNLLLPIHRVVRERVRAKPPSEEEWRVGLPGWEVRDVPLPDAAAIPELLAQHLAPLAARPAFAVDDDSGRLRIFSQAESLGGELMVRVLEREVLANVFGLEPEEIRDGAVSFPKSAARAAQQVREGDGVVALYLNALEPDDVFRVTGAGEVMPQKSTFFYPKVPTGMVFRVHGEDG